MIKKSKKNVIILTVIGVMIAGLIGTCFWGYSVLTRDELPEMPFERTDSKALSSALAGEMFLSGKVTLEAKDLNSILYGIRDALNKSLQEKGSKFHINQLFASFADDEIILNCRAEMGFIPVYAQLRAGIQFISPDLELVIRNFKIGGFTLKPKTVTGYLSRKILPENVSVSGDRICYDTSLLRDMLIDAARQNAGIRKAEELIDGLAGLFSLKFRAEDLFNLSITDAEIKDEKIIIYIEP